MDLIIHFGRKREDINEGFYNFGLHHNTNELAGNLYALSDTMFDLDTDRECYFCGNFSQVEDEEKCYIYGYPNHGISLCNDFIKKK